MAHFSPPVFLLVRGFFSLLSARGKEKRTDPKRGRKTISFVSSSSFPFPPPLFLPGPLFSPLFRRPFWLVPLRAAQHRAEVRKGESLEEKAPEREVLKKSRWKKSFLRPSLVGILHREAVRRFLFVSLPPCPSVTDHGMEKRGNEEMAVKGRPERGSPLFIPARRPFLFFFSVLSL